MAHDEQSKPKPWEPNGPSPNPKGRPPTKHLKAMVSFIDPQAGEFIDFDRMGTGVFDANGKENRANRFSCYILQRSDTPLKYWYFDFSEM